MAHTPAPLEPLLMPFLPIVVAPSSVPHSTSVPLYLSHLAKTTPGSLTHWDGKRALLHLGSPALTEQKGSVTCDSAEMAKLTSPTYMP